MRFIGHSAYSRRVIALQKPSETNWPELPTRNRFEVLGSRETKKRGCSHSRGPDNAQGPLLATKMEESSDNTTIREATKTMKKRTTLGTKKTLVPERSKPTWLKTEGAKASSESSELIQYGATKIPTKITAHLSGLPKPQVAVTTRVPPVPKRATSEKLHAAARITNQPLGDAAEKRAGCQHRVSPDKESISDRSHSGDSGNTDCDSGLGHSLSDPPAGSECGGKAESSSKMLQVESSPVLKEGVGNELESAVLPTTLPVGAQPTTVDDGTASKMGVYDQPVSYAAYRGILSYRRNTPLKKYSEAPQWKRTVEPKRTKGFSSATRAVIANGILNKGAKAAHAAKDCSPEQKKNEGIAKGPPLPSAPQSPSKEEKSAGFLSPTRWLPNR
ncbi:hypothetical protein HPB50_019017 [Hyalomma asiaticum]|uniref:Uncharacterized protein n=1 Tax=Hyalomma asiaticum TaxID=266040 RepID=A0ACB7T3H3_HYAAI|nr:hypothetical protein HPB50_019017 [Hyalomma asiaticum]